MTSGEISKSARLIDGTPYCFDRKLVSSCSLEDAQLGEAVAEARAGLALLFLRLLQLLERDQVFAYEQLTESAHFIVCSVRSLIGTLLEAFSLEMHTQIRALPRIPATENGVKTALVRFAV